MVAASRQHLGHPFFLAHASAAPEVFQLPLPLPAPAPKGYRGCVRATVRQTARCQNTGCSRDTEQPPSPRDALPASVSGHDQPIQTTQNPLDFPLITGE
jgi:hypothetical protein